MSEFADSRVTESLISAATCVITCFMNMVANKGSKKCSTDDLMPVIDFQRVISKQDDQSSLQANKHVIEYSATIYKIISCGRQHYYTFCVNLELELFNCAETESGKQISYLLNLRNMIPIFYNISNPIQGQFCCSHVQMLLHNFEFRILLSDNFFYFIRDSKEKVTQRKPVIQVLIKLALQKLCNQIKKSTAFDIFQIIFEMSKLYNDFCDDLYKLQLNIDPDNLVEFDVLRERYQHDFYHEFERAQPENEFSIKRKIYYRAEFNKIFTMQANFGEKTFFFISDSYFKGVEEILKHLYPHHTDEFQEEVFIADGGFGKVYKARHCLDGKEYAIKKITVKHNTEWQLNEVKVLAALNHPNIVSYKTAWIERRRFEEFDSSTDKIEKRAEENTTEESSSDVVSFRNSKSNENLDQDITNTSTGNSLSCEESSGSSREVNMYTPENKLYDLYIQMALCEKTLEQLLYNTNNYKKSVMPASKVKAIFQQIVCGVDYMHAQKIVHHDIKPSNIFISIISEQPRVQLGDFGLSCLLRKDHSAGGFGTPGYAAPEQLQGKCDPKSDIYSIGVVLTECLVSSQTELDVVITSLRSNKVPEALKQYKWPQIIKQLVQEDPINRPSANQLLQIFNHDKNVTINRLKTTNAHLKNNNNNKDDKIQDLLQENALLKEKIQDLLQENALLKEKIQELTDNTTRLCTQLVTWNLNS